MRHKPIGKLEELSAFQFTHPGRGATDNCRRTNRSYQFQFTHPGRGATWNSFTRLFLYRSFNSRTPGGVRQIYSDFYKRDDYVSIHAPREGCDSPLWSLIPNTPPFQFTHPGRGATQVYASCTAGARRFNSRTPGGVRLSIESRTGKLDKFQFTHPGRGATCRSDSRSGSEGKFQFTHPGRGATIGYHR